MPSSEKREKIFDDLAKIAGSTAGALSGLSRQIKEEIRVRVDELALRFDLVPREDFDELTARVDALQKRLDDIEKPKKPAAKKTAAKKTTKKTATPKKAKSKK